MSENARALLKRLDIHETSIAEELGYDRLGIGLLTALKEFDYYHYNVTRQENTDTTDLHFHVLRLGLPRTVSEVLSRVPAFAYPEATFQSNKELILAALDATAGLGFIENGRRLAHAALAGECEVKALGEDEFEVLLPKTMFALEEHEQIIEQHYRNQHYSQMRAAAAKAFTKRTRKRISKLLSKNVFVFRDKFIGYGAHPELDDYFFGLAYAKTMINSSYDEFRHDLNFGGVTFHKYVLSAVYFLFLAFKHEAFCEALLKKSPQIRLRDILTITCDKKAFRDSLIDALNYYGPSFQNFSPVTEAEADTILKVMSVRRDNLKILSSTMAPVPFLVEFSKSAWAKSTAGAQLAPMEFLLNALRFNFPAEYDRNQRTREQSMRAALKRLISQSFSGIIFIDAIKIRDKHRVITDIDYIAVEPESGTVLLFQLKHQDQYGADMRRRSNRILKLREEVAGWLDSVRQWVQRTSREDIASAFRLPKGISLQKIRMVVLTRHFAHALSELDMRDDCSYATWMQFVDALTRIDLQQNDTPTFLGLFDILQNYMSHKIANIVTADTDDVFHVRSLSLRVRQI